MGTTGQPLGDLSSQFEAHLLSRVSADRTGRRWQLPGHIALLVPPGGSAGTWGEAIRSADRAACRAVRRALFHEWGHGWTFAVPDLVAELHNDAAAVAPTVVELAQLQGRTPTARLTIPGRERMALELRVIDQHGALLGSYPVAPDLTFGSGWSAGITYRGPKMAHLDEIALQVLAAGIDSAQCLVVDRRPVRVERSVSPLRQRLSRKETFARQRTFTVAPGDRIWFEGLGRIVRLEFA
jgi:hypothetical protein